MEYAIVRNGSFQTYVTGYQLVLLKVKDEALNNIVWEILLNKEIDPTNRPYPRLMSLFKLQIEKKGTREVISGLFELMQ